MHSILTDLADLRPEIDAALERACQFSDDCPDRLAEAIRYAVLAPGKRLRPSLVIMATEACGGGRAAAMPAAVAVEMIHAYSLIHDDLPAMDDDDLRRGRPTTHIAFDEATAILAGDALQAEAFSHLVTRVSCGKTASFLVRELATAASATGLVGGQADDLAAEEMTIAQVGGVDAARDWLDRIHRRKTGALFAACVRMGGISAGADQTAIAALSRFADHLGLAFQITDDVLDHTADDATLGKRVGKDAGRGKFTYPLLLSSSANDELCLDQWNLSDGVERARAHAASLIDAAHESLALFGDAAARLHRLADYVMERHH